MNQCWATGRQEICYGEDPGKNIRVYNINLYYRLYTIVYGIVFLSVRGRITKRKWLDGKHNNELQTEACL